jgi:hypothetical protein
MLASKSPLELLWLLFGGKTCFGARLEQET